jgi:putative endonuclease
VPQQDEQDKPVAWQVYIILCSDNSLYTGITTDIERRMTEHATGTGAKYFRGRTPQQVVYLEDGHDRSSASRREAEIKKMRPDEKRRLIASA